MTDHTRKTIRAAAVAALKGVADPRPTAAGVRWYPNRMEPIFKKEPLPLGMVYVLRERVDRSWNVAPRELKRVLTIAIEGYLELVAELDDTMDAFARQIETVMHRDPTLGGACADLWLADTDIDLASDGERPVGLLRLTYEVTYYTPVPDESDEEREAFELAQVRYNAGGDTHTDDVAVDHLEPEQ